MTGSTQTPLQNKKDTGTQEAILINQDHSDSLTHQEQSDNNAAGANAHQPGLFEFSALSSEKKIGIIKKGISKNQLEEIKKEANLDYDTLSNLLAVSRTTLIKKKGDEKFDQPTSERIMLIADLVSYGYEVFESKALFNQWMKAPNKALGGKAPLTIIDTLYGLQEVKKELGRIAHSVY